MSETTGRGVISQTGLMQKLVQAKKVMQKVETGQFEKGSVNEEILRSDPEELLKSQSTQQSWAQNPPVMPNGME